MKKGTEDLRMSVDNDQLPFLIPAARKKREKMKLFFPRISFSLYNLCSGFLNFFFAILHGFEG